MQARIKWVEQRSFVAESGSGHAIVIDAPVANGGRALGPSPMELMLMGAGGCTAVDVVSILEKMRQAVTDCSIELEADRPQLAAGHEFLVVPGKPIGRRPCLRRVGHAPDPLQILVRMRQRRPARLLGRLHLVPARPVGAVPWRWRD